MHTPSPQQRRRLRHSELPPLNTRFSKPVREYYVPANPVPSSRAPVSPPPMCKPPRYPSGPSLGTKRPPYPVTYAGSRHGSDDPYETILASKKSTSLQSPPAVWSRKDYVPFGGNQPSPLPSPTPPAYSQSPQLRIPRSTPEGRSQALVDEISAMVQAEIDEIERELNSRSVEVQESTSALSQPPAVDSKFRSAISATLCAPFSDVYEDYVDEGSDDHVEEATENEPSGEYNANRASFSSSTTDITGQSLASSESATPSSMSSVDHSALVLSSGASQTENFNAEEVDVKPLHYLHTPPATDLSPIEPRAAPVDVRATQMAESTLSESSPDSLVSETSSLPRQQEPPGLTPNNAICGSSAPTAIVTPPTPITPDTGDRANMGGNSLFEMIRRSLTFKEKLWKDLEEEEDCEGYTDEFDQVVEEYVLDTEPASGKVVRIGTIRRRE